MRIAFVSYKYNWESMSVIRSTFETLCSRSDVETIWYDSPIDVDQSWAEQVWLFGSLVETTQNYFLRATQPIVAFGLSDPHLYKEERVRCCDAYVTNCLDLAETTNSHWMPISCDKRFHGKMPVKKETEALFIGNAAHPQTDMRRDLFASAREQGISLKVFGSGWPEHPLNFDFVSGRKLVEEINKASVCIDVSNTQAPLSHRIMASLGCGTPILTVKRRDTSHMLTCDGVFYYDNWKDIPSILKDILSLGETHLNHLGQTAMQFCHAAHDVGVRVHDLLTMCRELGTRRLSKVNFGAANFP